MVRFGFFGGGGSKLTLINVLTFLFLLFYFNLFNL